MTNSSLLKIHENTEIVDLPIQNGWIFHGCVNVYQRVYPIKITLQSIIRVHTHKRQHEKFARCTTYL